MSLKSYDLNETSLLVNDFIKTHKIGIETIRRISCPNADPNTFLLDKELFEELNNSCISFLNKNSSFDELNSLLFYTVNEFYKSRSEPLIKNKTTYICPGCNFLGKNNSYIEFDTFFKCDLCESSIKDARDNKLILLLKTFSKHNKSGFRCNDCNRFIPKPLDDNLNIVCPYFDCCFVGKAVTLNKMNHPTINSKQEKSQANVLKKEQLYTTSTSLDMPEYLKDKIQIIDNVIENQISCIPYNSSDFTIRHKNIAYQAHQILLKKYPSDMVEYLLNNSRSGGFQCKLFQQYILLLEASLPILFKKNKRLCRVDSLLDNELCLFDGISTFSSIITDKLSIKNETTELYIGGRKASYTKPYYIGKLLSIIDRNNKKSILDKVIGYNFSKIMMKDVTPGTEVTVSHLRVPPHYQMGGMVYINRVRKKIVEGAKSILDNE